MPNDLIDGVLAQVHFLLDMPEEPYPPDHLRRLESYLLAIVQALDEGLARHQLPWSRAVELPDGQVLQLRFLALPDRG